jgi:hypothetical protein
MTERLHARLASHALNTPLHSSDEKRRAICQTRSHLNKASHGQTLLTATLCRHFPKIPESMHDRIFEHYALDTERGDFIKGGTTVLESIIRCPGCRAEGLSTSPTLVATTPFHLVV